MTTPLYTPHEVAWEALGPDRSPLRLKGRSHQTAPLLEFVNSGETVVASFGPDGAMVLGLGEDVYMNIQTPGLVMQLTLGTSGSPDTGFQPTLKASRVVNVTQAALDVVTGGAGADGGEQMAVIYGAVNCSPTCEVQGVGVAGSAFSNSTVGAPGNDACAVYGTAWHDGTGSGIGAFFIGAKGVPGAKGHGIQLALGNYSGVNDSYAATGAPSSAGIFIGATGDADAAVGIIFGNFFGHQVDVGIGFSADLAGGKTGLIKTASIRDDSTAITVFDINGSHTDGLDLVGGTFSGDAIKLGANSIRLKERTAPSAPAADEARLWIEDNGAGKTRLMALFASGAAQQLAIQP